ncbi:MAG TPA: HisA/HisF-related TIM barrel protein [Planctomycetota bacterium]|nr:HisA/HisF-related TIM barrel protein [Planctomycetota bacterium]
MEPVRIIPCLDMKNGRVVKGVHFVDLKDVGDPVQAAKAYCKQGADEIAFLDITATVEGRRTMFKVAAKVADAIDVPFTIGGGIKTLDDVASALEAGATCASISSAAFRDPDMINEAVEEFGGESIVIAIDADRNDAMPSGREVYIDGGRTATGKDAVEFAKEMADIGVGQILPTSKGADGTTTGYDLELTRAIAETTRLPVIASGGAGKLEDFHLAATRGKANGLLAASVFHFGTFTVRQVKDYLKQKGIPVLE